MVFSVWVLSTWESLSKLKMGKRLIDSERSSDMANSCMGFLSHPLLFHDDIHIHGCIDETTLSHLNSSCFLCSLFGSNFDGGYSFTSWMKEHMADYLDAHYNFLE